MRSWPLRWTIPAIALVLVLITELVLGATTLAIVERTLRDQADRKVEQVAQDLLARPGQLGMGMMGDQQDTGQPSKPRSEVLAVVYKEDGTIASALTERLNDGRAVPDVEIRLDATHAYTSRANGEAWRVLVTTSPRERATIVTMIPLRDSGSATTALRRALVVLGVAVALTAAGLAAIATRRSLKPLATAEGTAAAIAAGDLSRRVPTYPPGSEAASLAASLNAMLDRLTASMAASEASEAKLRRFVADASHELRTPLAAIRGYAELSRMGADLDGRAMERIEANAERMAAMVSDLLILARYDESAASLGGQDLLDLAALVEDAAADLRVQDPSRIVSVTAQPGCLVRGSGRHLGQLLANLAGNVLSHTPQGSPVEFGVRRVADMVEVVVRDHGPGFGQDHAARVFERFYRADSSRARDTGGSGLGLAIVAAIAAAHGGTASASDSPTSPGAVICVTLPAANP